MVFNSQSLNNIVVTEDLDQLRHVMTMIAHDISKYDSFKICIEIL